MTRYLLDTNIISNVTKPAPSESLIAWMTERADESLFVASLTIAEIWRGVLEKPAGKKPRELEAWFRRAGVRQPVTGVRSRRPPPALPNASGSALAPSCPIGDKRASTPPAGPVP